MKKYKLNECTDILAGGTPSTKNEKYWNGNIPWLSVKDFGNVNKIVSETEKTITLEGFNKCPSNMLHKGDLILSARGTVGKIAMVDKDMAFNQSCFGIRTKKNICNSDFIFYWYLNNQKIFKGAQQGNVFKSVTLDFFEKTEANLPSLEIQQKIAAVLSSLDDKIALNNRINAKLEQMAKRLYDYWFVQFDFPVSCHSELVSESHSDEMLNQVQHDECAKPYKSNGGKMVWNETLKREIPDGWEVKKISEILECEIPGDWGEENIKGKHDYKVSCIRGCDMVDMTNLPTRYILQVNAKKLLQADDFVIEISGGSPTQSTGRIVQITDEIIKRFNGKIICSNFCHGIRLNDKDYASYFFQMWNMFYLNNIFFNYEGKTSGLKNFQFNTFVSETWYVPPKELVRKYHEVVSKFRKQIDKNESETQKLTVLRDRLLPLLMNGQVEVK